MDRPRTSTFLRHSQYPYAYPRRYGQPRRRNHPRAGLRLEAHAPGPRAPGQPVEPDAQSVHAAPLPLASEDDGVRLPLDENLERQWVQGVDRVEPSALS